MSDKILYKKFRGQHPIDGSVHNNSNTISNDILRQNDLEMSGYRVIRFMNAEVFEQVDIVIKKISESVNNIIKNKPPINGG